MGNCTRRSLILSVFVNGAARHESRVERQIRFSGQKTSDRVSLALPRNVISPEERNSLGL